MSESLVGTTDAAAAVADHYRRTPLVHLAHHAKRHWGRHNEAVDTGWDIAVGTVVLEDSLARGHGFGSFDVVQVGGTEPVADDTHDSMDRHSHGREELVVVVLGGTAVDWAAECWVARKGRWEANAQSEKAEGDERSERAVV